MQIQHHSDHQLVVRHRPWKSWLLSGIFFLWSSLLFSGIFPTETDEIYFGLFVAVMALGGFIWRGSILVYDFNKKRGSLRIIRLQPIGKRLTHHPFYTLDEVELKQCRYRGQIWYRIRLVWKSGKFHRLNTDGWNNENDARSIAQTIAEFVGVPFTFNNYQGWFS